MRRTKSLLVFLLATRRLVPPVGGTYQEQADKGDRDLAQLQPWGAQSRGVGVWS